MKIVKLNESTTLSRDRKLSLLSDFSNTIDTNSSRFDKNAAKVAQIISRDLPKTNKESKSIIKHFLDDIDVETLSTVFLLAGTIITSIVKLYRGIRRLNENDPILNFVVLDNNDIQFLMENQDFELNDEQKLELDDLKIAKVLDDESNQFDFSSGFKMEAINSLKLPNMKFSLKWHKDNTASEDEFLSSVKLFLSTVQTDLTDDDILRLRKHYQRYLNK